MFCRAFVRKHMTSALSIFSYFYGHCICSKKRANYSETIKSKATSQKKTPSDRKEPKAIRMIKQSKEDLLWTAANPVALIVWRKSRSVLSDHGWSGSFCDCCCPANAQLPSRWGLASKLVMLSGLWCRSHRWDAAHHQ